ncbi:MAG: hypothetical protein M4D80_08830 [Myxococcota bacterium]|nr:hypothetical protein [Deltaproteobacteria bacterium]MDQ3335254.1 hypothetical protein [Myxococcota bacterium]
MFSLDLTADGRAVYFASGTELWVARRARREDPFGAPTSLGIDGAAPSIGAGELELYFSRGFTLNKRSRESLDAPFAFEAEVATPGVQLAHSVEISSDGTELLLIGDDQLNRMNRTCE